MNETSQATGASLISKADKEYVPFAPFSEWAQLDVDRARFEAEKTAMEALAGSAGSDPEKLKRALHAVKMITAVDTGRIENLYEIDRGVTITAAVHITLVETALEKSDARARRLIDSQLAVYDELLDFATGKMPLAEAYVRHLHEKLCAAQETYDVDVAGSKQARPLPLGVYKALPNHVLLPDGTVRPYAPPMETPAEMQRLFVELNSAAFADAHPIIQAAYAHHALSAIHPFTDGNGRTARALASIFIYRAVRVPLMVLLDHRDAYFNALLAADQGHRQVFVDFVGARCFEALRLIRHSLQIAASPSPEEMRIRILNLYRTEGGYTHEEVDVTAKRLVEIAKARGSERATQLSSDSSVQVSVESLSYERKGVSPPTGYRAPAGEKITGLTLKVQTISPAASTSSMNFFPWAPLNAKVTDPVLLTNQPGEIVMAVLMSELSPGVSLLAEVEIGLALEGMFSKLLETAFVGGGNSLRGTGYSIPS
jgi:Fic family protein